jgi:DNA-binding LacI/PurR family transcriptional regulator
MTVSIIHVANKANVSRMTVTRVMRGEDTVSPETRDRVLHAMQELGYVPSPAARAMRSKDKLRSQTSLCFALIFGSDTQLADGFFCDIARGAEEQASKFGICPLQVHWQNTFEASWSRMQSVFAIKGLCGAVLVGQFREEEVRAILQHTEHVVIVDGPAPANLPVASVESENYGGCRLALEHLYEKGSRRVLVLAGPRDHYFSKAMVLAAESLRERFEVLEIIHTDYTCAAGSGIVHDLRGKGKRFNGIFGNDELAVGALRALSDLKVPVPGLIRVIGFDDIPHGEFTVPRLTSISVDKKQLGREAVTSLVEMTRGQMGVDQVKKVIRAKLVVREST